MGGGDLNLKKSWHPSTLRNIERVWKAEQKHEVEKQKIEQLQKELAEERAREEIQAFAVDQGVVKKREERLDWMYQGPAAMINREDYLMGRKVDKSLDLLEQAETGVEPKNDDHDIGATMFSSQDLSGTATVDLANKIREDPLFSIMKKEKEQRKNLLLNPVKMKQLQKMLQVSIHKDGKKKKKKSKRSSDDDEEIRHHKKHKKSKSHSKSHLCDEDDEMHTRKHQDHHSKSKKSSSDEDMYHRKGSSSRNYQNFRPRSPSRDREHNHLTSRHGDRYYSRETYNKSQTYKDRNSDSGGKKKLDDKERERRLKEMQENARWIEEQRERKVRRYREDEEREEKASKMNASDFIKPMLSKAAGKGSLENRVKQKIFSIQRSSADMDKHFARR